MKLKKQLILAALLIPAPVVMADDDNDFGVWTELSVEKHLTTTLDLGFEGELRTADGVSQVDRLSGGLKLSYKPSKYFKFAVCGMYYGEYQPEKVSKESYFESDHELAGYRFTEGNWKPNVRVYAEATATRKFWKWLRISLRERYQFNHEFESSALRTEYEREELFTPAGPQRGDWESTTFYKKNPAEDRHRLRSRLKFEYDKKGCDWSPFVSVELHNKLDWKMNLNKVRAGVGTEYKITSQHKVGLAYLYSCSLDKDPNENKHAVNISYGFDFW